MTRERMEIRDINFNRNTNGWKRRIATKNFCLETVWRIKFSVVSKLESIIFSLPIKINSNFILFISCLKKGKWRQDEYSYRWIGKNSKGRITDAPILSVWIFINFLHNGDLYRVTSKYRERRGCGIYRASHREICYWSIFLMVDKNSPADVESVVL